MWKVWALFLGPVVPAVVAAAVIAGLRTDPAPWPSAGLPAGPRRPEVPRIESFTRHGFEQYIAAYPAALGGPADARRAFLEAAYHADRSVAGYGAVEREHAGEAFRLLMLQHWDRPFGPVVPGADGRTFKVMGELIAAHEARCGPDPDPETGLYKAYLLVREGRYAEAEPMAARAVEAFPGPPGREGRREAYLARSCRVEVFVEQGRWKDGPKLDLPPGVRLDFAYWHLLVTERRDEAGQLLDRAAATPAEPVLARCRADFEYDRGRWADALASAEAFLAAPDAVPGWAFEVGVIRVKALARLGRFADADRALGELGPPGEQAWLKDRAELLVALLAGNADRADRLLSDNRVTLATAYGDPELGPLVQADGFAGLRAKHPRPPNLPR